MASVDPARVARIVREVAEAAVLPRFRNLAPGEIKTKSRPDDLVTIADTELERLLTAALTALLPGSVVVGEEAVAADASVLARLEEEAPVWILDPVDGTLSFANGDPGFAMIVALAIGGRTVAEWIHDPVGDRTAYAGLGEGAWIDGRRVHAAADRPIANLRGAVWWRPAVEKLAGKVQDTKPWGSAGRVYMALAEGTIGFVIFRSLNPWDHAAGVLLHLEAGGTAALIDGTPYRPVPLKMPLISAPGPESWAELQALLST